MNSSAVSSSHTEIHATGDSAISNAHTKLHADILVRILLPQFFVAVCIAHQGEDHVLNDALQSDMFKRLSITAGPGQKNLANKVYISMHSQF